MIECASSVVSLLTFVNFVLRLMFQLELICTTTHLELKLSLFTLGNDLHKIIYIQIETEPARPNGSSSYPTDGRSYQKHKNDNVSPDMQAMRVAVGRGALPNIRVGASWTVKWNG